MGGRTGTISQGSMVAARVPEALSSRAGYRMRLFSTSQLAVVFEGEQAPLGSQRRPMSSSSGSEVVTSDPSPS